MRLSASASTMTGFFSCIAELGGRRLAVHGGPRRPAARPALVRLCIGAAGRATTAATAATLLVFHRHGHKPGAARRAERRRDSRVLRFQQLALSAPHGKPVLHCWQLHDCLDTGPVCRRRLQQLANERCECCGVLRWQRRRLHKRKRRLAAIQSPLLRSRFWHLL